MSDNNKQKQGLTDDTIKASEDPNKKENQKLTVEEKLKETEENY